MSENNIDVVTGGCGFIGSHLVDALLAAGRRVRVLDNLAVGRRSNLEQHSENSELSIIEGDVSDPACVADLIQGADRVFHLAAMADIVPSIENPELYYRANVDGTFNVVQASNHAGVRRLVYAASSSCYGIPDIYPTPESYPAGPQYPYALTKYLGEQIVLHWAQVYSLPALSLRFFNVYGPRARTAGSYGAVFGVFLAQLAKGEPLTIVGDGTQTRDFTYVADVVTALMAAAESKIAGEIYNVGSGQTVSVNRIVELLGAKEHVQIPKRPGEPDCTFADISRIIEALDWKPRVSIEDGIANLTENMAQWADAPLWTPEKIERATSDWFKYLGDESAVAPDIEDGR